MPEITDPGLLRQLSSGPVPQATAVPRPSAPPAQPRGIPGTPKAPAQPAPVRPVVQAKDELELESEKLRQQKLQQDIDDAKAKAAPATKTPEDISDTVHQLRTVADAARQAKELSNGLFATGFGSKWAKDIGGTGAADVGALLNTIGANTAFDRLQKMREQSKTGGALGSVSEVELQLLRDSIASIEQSQSDEQFRSNMDKVIGSYERVIDRLEGRDPDLKSNPLAYGEDALGKELAKIKDGWIADFRKRNPKSNAEGAWQRIEADARRRFNTDPRIKRLSGDNAGSKASGGAKFLGFE